MMWKHVSCIGLVINIALAAPLLEASAVSTINPVATLDASLISLINSIVTKTAVKNPYSTILSALEAIQPTASITAIPQASRAISTIHAATPTPPNIFDTAAKYIEAGLSNQKVSDLITFLGGPQPAESSDNNTNTRSPAKSIYPKAGPSDAPYSLTQAQLRAAIYIPAKFQYGKGGQPVILVPGTTETGYSTYRGSLIPLLQQSSIADPVWLNIPGEMLRDVQVNSEYIAYAIGYISGISQSAKVAVVGFSQGTVASQWALKYWPSTRNLVTDLISISGDYRGTLEFNPFDVGVIPIAPAIIQQATTSNFMAAVRNQNGLSAYVPTTNIYSATDESVEPQSGTAASGSLNSTRSNATVTNNEVQVVCAGAVAGTAYDHYLMLYNPLTYALLIDALQHAGPGQPSRLNLASVCSSYTAPGITITDVLDVTTFGTVNLAVANALYPDKTTQEPPVMAYAK